MFRNRKKTRAPGPTGSGRIIWNVDWWFWDDIGFPGLIDSENFSELRRAALSEEEYGKLVSAMMKSDIVTSGRYNSAALRDREAYFVKLNEFLIQAKKAEPEKIQQWIGRYWE